MSSGAYYASIKNGWIDEISKHLLRRAKPEYWNNKILVQIEAKKYKNRYNLFKENPTAYKYSSINGWLDEFYPKTLIYRI